MGIPDVFCRTEKTLTGVNHHVGSLPESWAAMTSLKRLQLYQNLITGEDFQVKAPVSQAAKHMSSAIKTFMLSRQAPSGSDGHCILYAQAYYPPNGPPLSIFPCWISLATNWQVSILQRIHDLQHKVRI